MAYKSSETEESYRAYFDFAREHVLSRLAQCQLWAGAAAIETSSSSVPAPVAEGSTVPTTSAYDVPHTRKPLTCAIDLFARLYFNYVC